MNRLIGTVSAFFFTAGIGSIVAPEQSGNGFFIMTAAAGLGFVLGSIADALAVSRPSLSTPEKL